MASRNIASMHLFLEMKTKFPYLPEDTLRNYSFLYAQDQAKCISMLQKESENHFHPSQQFSDFCLPENKLNFKANENLTENSMLLSIPFQDSKNQNTNSSNIKNNNFIETNLDFRNNSTKYSGVILQQKKSTNPPQTQCHSAPIVNSEKPFFNMYQSVPDSSHEIWKKTPCDQTCNNRMIFSTTKEHIIQPNEIQGSTNKNNENASQRHAVKLSITPMLPYQQQQRNVYSNAISASAAHSSRPGRHTTSLNFQLQPQPSNQFPLEISSVPTGMGKPSNHHDFGSHVQISVGPQGTTFTALRLQRPSPTTKSQNMDYSSNKISSDEAYFRKQSSQAFNSKMNVFPTSPTNDSSLWYGKSVEQQKHTNPHNYKRNDSAEQNKSSSHSDLRTTKFCIEESNSSLNHQSYQFMPDYIQAVKRHQHSQLSLVQEELNKAKSICSNLKSEVNRIEGELSKQKENKTLSSYTEVIKKLKEENRHLRLECNCLIMEYDMCSKGLPVGITDEDFYSNIFTGPNDGFALLHSGKNISKEKSSSPEITVSDEDDEKNAWKCKKCTFVNHPALEKCEMCEISKNSGSFFDDS